MSVSWWLRDDCSSFVLSRENSYRADGTCRVQARIPIGTPVLSKHRICNLIFFVILFGGSSHRQWISLVQLGCIRLQGPTHDPWLGHHRFGCFDRGSCKFRVARQESNDGQSLGWNSGLSRARERTSRRFVDSLVLKLIEWKNRFNKAFIVWSCNHVVGHERMLRVTSILYLVCCDRKLWQGLLSCDPVFPVLT